MYYPIIYYKVYAGAVCCPLLNLNCKINIAEGLPFDFVST